MAEPPPTYTREEMDAILKRAIERQQAKSEGIGHEELVEAAGEVGIPREEVEAAARELGAQKAKAEPPGVASEGIALSGDRGRQVRRFFRRAATFGVMTAFMFFLSGMQLNGWWIWPAMGFGLSLSIQAIRILFGDDRDEDRADARDRRPTRRERRRARREEKLAEFEEKVAIGAEALVRVIEEARRARSGGGPVARPEPVKQRVIVTPAPPVRVEPRETEAVEREETEALEGRQKRAP